MADVLHLSARPAFGLTVVHLDPLHATIRAAGELDLAARGPLAELLEQQQIAGRRVISLDLAEVTFLDCSCVGVLVAAHQRFLECHGLLVLTDVDARVARLLRATGLEDHLFITPAGASPSRPRAS
jgi:anti-sigma B factor antagonist